MYSYFVSICAFNTIELPHNITLSTRDTRDTHKKAIKNLSFILNDVKICEWHISLYSLGCTEAEDKHLVLTAQNKEKMLRIIKICTSFLTFLICVFCLIVSKL